MALTFEEGETVPIYGTFSICIMSVSGRRGGGQFKENSMRNMSK